VGDIHNITKSDRAQSCNQRWQTTTHYIPSEHFSRGFPLAPYSVRTYRIRCVLCNTEAHTHIAQHTTNNNPIQCQSRQKRRHGAAWGRNVHHTFAAGCSLRKSGEFLRGDGLNIQNLKGFQLQGLRSRPRDQGSAPCTPLWALPPNPRLQTRATSSLCLSTQHFSTWRCPSITPI